MGLSLKDKGVALEADGPTEANRVAWLAIVGESEDPRRCITKLAIAVEEGEVNPARCIPLYISQHSLYRVCNDIDAV